MAKITYFDSRVAGSEPAEFGSPDTVSFSSARALERETYAIPLTQVGVSLQSMGQGGTPEFMLHEFGNRLVTREWNATGVLSPFWRLYYNATEGARIWHEGREIALKPDTIWFIAENTRFDCRADTPVEHMWLHFTLRPTYAFEVHQPLGVPVDEVLSALLKSLRSQQLPPRDSSELRQLFYGSMALLNATFARVELPPARLLPPLLREVLRKIERDPRENLSNARLAALCGMSVGGFTRLFVHHIGLPPAVYVRRIRLNLASRLLAFTELSVEQIAEATGFANRHYFTRMFTRHLGCGPATFRKSYQNGQMSGPQQNK